MISALSSPQVSTCIIYPFVYQDIFTELSNKTGSHFYRVFWAPERGKMHFSSPKRGKRARSTFRGKKRYNRKLRPNSLTPKVNEFLSKLARLLYSGLLWLDGFEQQQ